MLDRIEADKKAMKKLLELEAELSTRLNQLTSDMSKSHSRDSDEQAVERENDEVVENLENETMIELKQVKNAIQRLNQGNYHECMKCGLEISPERLEAIPYTNLCISCADSL